MEIKGKPGEPVEAVTTAPEVPPEETNEVEPQKPEIDYAAELEKEKARREKAEFALYKKNKAERQAKKVEPETEEVFEPEPVEKLVEEKFNSLAEQHQTRLSESIISRKIKSLTDNPDEQRLIRFNYDNKINKSGFSEEEIESDLEDAHFLANKSRFMKERKELVESAVSKRTISTSGGGTNLDRPERTEDLSKKFAKHDWEFMKKRNWSDEQIRKAAEELKNSK